MGKVKKATKKFKQTKLKDTVEKRKKAQEIQKQRKKKTSKGKKQSNGGEDDDLDEEVEEEKEKSRKWDDMTVDEFMNEGFLEDDEDEEAEGQDVDLSDDDDEEGGEANEELDEEEIDKHLPKNVKAHKKGLESEIDKHKKELEELKKEDPEFFKYLQENDKGLLQFGGDEDDVDIYEGEDGEGEDDEEEEADENEMEEGEGEKMEKEEKKIDTDKRALTIEMLEKWEANILKTQSLRVIKQLLVAFRSCCLPESQETQARSRYHVNSPSVFQKTMNVTFRVLVPSFDKILGRTESDDGKNVSLQKLPKWRLVSSLVRSFFMSCLNFLENTTNPSVLSYVLKQIETALPYLDGLSKTGKHLLKILLNFWSSSEESVRVLSFLIIRKLAIQTPYPFIDFVMKGIYMYFVKNSKFVTPQTLPIINFMMNCVVEIYGLEFNSAYQHAFVYIRQLAIHLRNALVSKTKETQGAVYNWQYIQCLRVWGMILGTYCEKNLERERGKNALYPLIYPFVQTVLGTIRLIPTAKYFPLRFHCIQILNDLSEKTGIFIPVLPHLIDVFDSTTLKAKPKPSTQKRPSFSTLIKVSKNVLETNAYQDVVLETVIELILQYFNIHAFSISFPELSLPAVVQLKRTSKKMKNVKISKAMQQMVEKLEQNRSYIEKKRNGVDFTPQNVQKGSSFLAHEKPNSSPLRAYYNSLQAVRQKRRAIEEAQAARESEQTSKKAKRADKQVDKSLFKPKNSKGKAKPKFEEGDDDFDGDEGDDFDGEGEEEEDFEEEKKEKKQKQSQQKNESTKKRKLDQDEESSGEKSKTKKSQEEQKAEESQVEKWRRPRGSC